MQLCSSGPARASEQQYCIVENAGDYPRSVRIDASGLALLKLYYNKTNSMLDNTKVVTRYLTPRVGAMLIKYLILVKPVQEKLLQKLHPTFNSYKKLWVLSLNPTENKLQNLEYYFRNACGMVGLEIGIAGWRHMFKAIQMRYITTKTHHKLVETSASAFGHSKVTSKM